MPESMLHLLVRTLLFQILTRALAGKAAVGCDQFVYWNAKDPRVCLAPDGFVKLGAEQDIFRNWKTWERGTPELAVEVKSEWDKRAWSDKLDAYRELGVRELVFFDPEGVAGSRLRVWDRIDDDLVERVIAEERTPCLVLGLHWVVASGGDVVAGLRLAEDALGARMLLTKEEAAEEGKAVAERRVAELEAELRRRSP
jgi:hypothetical protein